MMNADSVNSCPHPTQQSPSEVQTARLCRETRIRSGCCEGDRSRPRTRCTPCEGCLQKPVQVFRPNRNIHRKRGNVHWPIHLRRQERQLDGRKCPTARCRTRRYSRHECGGEDWGSGLAGPNFRKLCYRHWTQPGRGQNSSQASIWCQESHPELSKRYDRYCRRWWSNRQAAHEYVSYSDHSQYILTTQQRLQERSINSPSRGTRGQRLVVWQ